MYYFLSMKFQFYRVLKPYLFLIYFASVLEEVFTKNIKLLDECGEVLSYLLA